MDLDPKAEEQPIKLNPHKEELVGWFDERYAIAMEDVRMSEREALRQTVKGIRNYARLKNIEESYLLDAFADRRDIQYQLLNEHAYEELDKMRARLKKGKGLGPE